MSAATAQRTRDANQMSMNPFSGMGTTPTMRRGQNLSTGRHKVNLSKLLFKTDLDDGGSAFIAEYSVLESATEQQGANRRWFQKKNKSYNAAVKGFMYAVLGYDESKPEHLKLLPEIDKRIEGLAWKGITHGVFNNRAVFVEVQDAKLKTPKEGGKDTWAMHTFYPATDPIPIEYLDKALALP